MKKPVIILLCISFLALCACSRAPEVPREEYSESWRDRPLPASFDLRSVDTDGDGKGDRCYVIPEQLERGGSISYTEVSINFTEKKEVKGQFLIDGNLLIWSREEAIGEFENATIFTKVQ